jgi:hypothetical protein
MVTRTDREREEVARGDARLDLVGPLELVLLHARGVVLPANAGVATRRPRSACRIRIPTDPCEVRAATYACERRRTAARAVAG